MKTWIIVKHSVRAALLAVAFGCSIAPATAHAATADDERVATNDNRRAAGVRQGDALALKLRAGVGLWRPEGDEGPALRVEAFGEESGPLQAPAPLIRVTEGSEIIASIRNDLASPLQVRGLCAHDGTTCAPIVVPPASEREVRFKAGRAGTYHYAASTTGVPIAYRAADDSQLSGAFIVDPPGHDPSAEAARDRVLVITEWTSITRAQLRELLAADDIGAAFLGFKPRFTFVINGLSWPATERLHYRLGEEVRWRVINLGSQAHPMHLHGFFFTVDSLGDGVRDTPFDEDHKPRVVTQLLAPGATMAMTWRPEREGNWLFHCHIAEHVSPERRLGGPAESQAGHDGHGGHGGDAAAGMAGMILGVTVSGGDGSRVDTSRASPRKLTLVMNAQPKRFGDQSGYGFALNDDAMSIPGPTLTLRRDEPVEITLVNHLPEATSIHWHGMELESYFDGVHGWSGSGTRTTPMIEPGESFIVRFTPPRAGTFMYHTHLHDGIQLPSGLYGALVVTEPDETFDPAFDHIVVIGRGGPGADAPMVLNGSRDYRFAWKAGARHRIRFMNITSNDIVVTSLMAGDTPVEWRPLRKDAAPVPLGDNAPRAAAQTMAVGETFDFEYQAPEGRQVLWINIRTPGGRWGVQSRVTVR